MLPAAAIGGARLTAPLAVGVTVTVKTVAARAAVTRVVAAAGI